MARMPAFNAHRQVTWYQTMPYRRLPPLDLLNSLIPGVTVLVFKYKIPVVQMWVNAISSHPDDFNKIVFTGLQQHGKQIMSLASD